MRRLIALLAVLLFLGPPAVARAGESIVGPDAVAAYRQVRLEAGEPGDDQEWVVFPIGVADGAELDPTGAKFLFTGPPGTYQVLLITVKAGKLSQAAKSVRIGDGPAPTPPVPTPTPPNPGPTPVPPGPAPLPDGKYGLAAFTRSVVASAAGLTMEQRVKGAVALAGVYRAGASQVAAGAITNPAELVKATGERNQAALGADYAAWRPVLITLQTKLTELSKGGTLATVQDAGQAWAEIASGFEAVR